jgi:hypothetical protein
MADYFCYFFFSSLMSRSPIPVQTNSHIRTISATKIAALAAKPNPVIDI